MKRFGVEWFTEYGFNDASTVSNLYCGTLGSVPAVSGSFAVLRLDTRAPIFLATSTASKAKGRDPSVGHQELMSRWIANCPLVYVGKSRRLRDAIGTLVRFGYGESATYWGGRYIWQLTNSEDLLILWRQTENEDEAEHVRLLVLGIFKHFHGKMPFANITDPLK